MKKTLLSLLLLVVATTMSGQTLLNGDLNHDGVIDLADVTALVNVALHKAEAEAIDVYAVNNTAVIGTWYKLDGTSFTFCENGTTTYPDGATYKYMYLLRWLQVYNSSGTLVKTMKLQEVTAQYLLEENDNGTTTRYTKSDYMVSGITLNETSLALNSGATGQLTATVSPSNALEKGVTWSSSNTSVATVNQNGLVTAVAGGTCTITCTAKDGSGKTATCEVSVTQLVTGITLSPASLTLDLVEHFSHTLTATVSPSNASDKGVTWSSSNTSVATVNQSGLVTAVSGGTCTITCTAKDGSGVVATCLVTVVGGGSDTHEYVNLGLPSGTLWATCNIGADSPEDYGDYFAWGETVPYGQEDNSNAHNYATTGSYTKSTFSWGTYKYCGGTSYDTQTKYCQDNSYGYNGFTDNLTELELDDDAAYVNWGANWRMPSYDQQTELRKKCTWTWTTRNGKNGYEVVGPNGNSLFLPAAGFCGGASLGDAGSYGYFWSRTLYASGPDVAYYLGFNSDYVDRDYDRRCSGQSVRPVRLSQN